MQFRKINALLTIETGFPIGTDVDDRTTLVTKRVAYSSINAAKRANRQSRFGVWQGKLPAQSKDCVQEYVK